MNREQKILVLRSFAQVSEISETAAALFYQRLFELDPELRPLFKSDLTEQGRKLMQMLALVVSGLVNSDTIEPALQRLGARHIGYGIRAEHYQTVGAALIWTLEQGLGAGFTGETRAAWMAVYKMVSEMMQRAAVAA